MNLIKVQHISEVYEGKYPFHQQLSDELLPILNDYPDQQDNRTNVKATHTEWDFQADNPHVKKLKKYILNEIDTYCPVSTVLDKESVKFCFHEMWANIYNKGDHTVNHHHLPHNYSFLYFLKAKWYHSPLVFRPRPVDRRYHKLDPIILSKKIRPREGKFVIFPSYLRHEVPMHRFKGQRITLSGNIRMADPW